MPTVRLLLPELRHCAASPEVAAGVLARWLARADRLPPAEVGTLPALRTLVQWPGTRLPVAALTRRLDADDAAQGAWLRADPAHVRPDLTTVRMLACGDLGLTADETEALLHALKPVFGDSDVPIDAPSPSRWYLQAASAAELPDCPAPDEILGDDLKLHLPPGPAGKRWRLLLNEAQVILHNHPVNAARAARGAVAVNSLWFWGAGALPAWARSACGHVLTPDPALASLAALADATPAPLDRGQMERLCESTGTPDIGIDLRTARAAVLEREWLMPLDARLRRRGLSAIELAFLSGERAVVRPGHRWRLWRRVRPLQR